MVEKRQSLENIRGIHRRKFKKNIQRAEEEDIKIKKQANFMSNPFGFVRTLLREKLQ